MKFYPKLYFVIPQYNKMLCKSLDINMFSNYVNFVSCYLCLLFFCLSFFFTQHLVTFFLQFSSSTFYMHEHSEYVRGTSFILKKSQHFVDHERSFNFFCLFFWLYAPSIHRVLLFLDFFIKREKSRCNK